MTTPPMLQVGPLMPFFERALVDTYGIVRLPDDRGSFLEERGKEFQIAVTSGKQGVSAELIKALPNLGAIVNFGVGYDTTDVEAAQSRGILISNTPDVLTDCVADIAIGLLIDTLRHISAADRFVRRGDWLTRGYPLTTKVSGRKVGIVGLGRIGQAIATRLEGFGCEISYHNRFKRMDPSYTYCDSPADLAEQCDVLVIAAAGGADSAGLIGARELAALGPAGFLINIARGSVIDQDALVAALTGGAIAGAGLDVFADEPQVPQELIDLDNVVLLPHLASGTHETREAMAELALRNIAQFIDDGSLVTPVS